MLSSNGHASHTVLLQNLARRAMVDRGLTPDFSAEALEELAKIKLPASGDTPGVRDLRALLWCSIDNDDSRDLDQLTVADPTTAEPLKILVAVANVAALVIQGSELDRHAEQNTTTVYTPAQIFPMLPEKLSTDLTSLNADVDRLAWVIELVVSNEGQVTRSDVYPGWVRNRAKLAYNSVASWFETQGPMPTALAAVPGLDQNLRIQLKAAELLKQRRHQQGALTFETTEASPVIDDGKVQALTAAKRNSAKDLIEDFMIAANGATAAFLAQHRFPSIRRVVRTPKYWPRIVELAAEHGTTLPPQADSRALEEFLTAQRRADPARFADLSLSVIKLLGAGEYVLELPGQTSAGHFGLAVKDYAHSTAPNRRFPDLLTQRLLQAASTGQNVPYPSDRLVALAKHCTEQEDAAKKVERQLVKSAAALLLQSQIGHTFNAMVTGAASKGTWVKIAEPPVEGKLVQGFENRRVGDRIQVRLLHTDFERGLIDFAAVG